MRTCFFHVQMFAAFGSYLANGWVLLKDLLGLSWVVVTRRYDPKHVPRGFRFICTDFIPQTTHKNMHNILGHTSTRKTSFRTSWLL